MSITVQEKFRGRTRSTGRNASAEIVYIIRATAGEDDEQVAAALLAQAPSTYRDLVREGIGFLEEIRVGDGIGTQIWEASVRYAPLELVTAEPGTGRISFRTTGGTQHISHSQLTIARYGRPGKNLINFKNGIGVQPGGSVQGTDIFVPIFEWQETHTFTAAQVSLSYIFTLYELTGTVNKELWRVFKPNDLLFVGAEGNQREDSNYDITFHFAAAKTKTFDTIGEVQAISAGVKITKRGWDYLWVHYREEEITLDGSTEKALISVPHQVNIEAVYDEGRFPDLGLGT